MAGFASPYVGNPYVFTMPWNTLVMLQESEGERTAAHGGSTRYVIISLGISLMRQESEKIKMGERQ